MPIANCGSPVLNRSKNNSLLPLFLLLILCAPLGLFACSDSDRPLFPDDPQSLQGKIPLPDLSPAEPYEVMYEAGIPIVRETDPEGARLYVNIYRPAAEGPFPVLLQAIAYRREIIALGKVPDSVKLAEAGYVVILMDIRGTGSSEGTWGCFSDDEVEDVAWIIDHWIPAQPWSNGKVGLFGPSYMGIIQMLTAARKPAHLKAIFPGVSMRTPTGTSSARAESSTRSSSCSGPWPQQGSPSFPAPRFSGTRFPPSRPLRST
jgi:hypothetical protein